MQFRSHGSSFPCFFFFKQKTAYEISVCDWSADVCSSDLLPLCNPHRIHFLALGCLFCYVWAFFRRVEPNLLSCWRLTWTVHAISFRLFPSFHIQIYKKLVHDIVALVPVALESCGLRWLCLGFRFWATKVEYNQIGFPGMESFLVRKL